MAKVRYLQSVKKADLRFKILSVNVEEKTARLIGSAGVEFDHKITKEELEKYGYTIVVVEEDEVPA